MGTAVREDQTRVIDRNREENVLVAPEHLGLHTRAAFRLAADAAIEAAPPGVTQLVIDLGRTREVDSAGLNTLVIIRRHAARRGQRVRLRGMSRELRSVFALTKLDRLFEIEEAAQG